MRKISYRSLFLFVAFFYGCAPPSTTKLAVIGRYFQDFSSREALFVRERNGAPSVVASAFLIDKRRGLFASAKHFVGSESGGDCKIFFNGVVYNGFLLRLPPTTDLAIIKIDGEFNSKSFPEPYLITNQTRVGDKVFVRGIHPHPSELQANKQVLPIFRDYYGWVGRNDEFVYDNLESHITSLIVKMSNKDIKDSASEELADVVNIYFELETMADHQFSFGGLSGGPVVNAKDELVGVTSNEVKGGYEFNGRALIKHPWKVLHLVPASELTKLMPQLADIK